MRARLTARQLAQAGDGYDPVAARSASIGADCYIDFESAPPTGEEMEAIRFIDEVLQPEDIGLVESVQRGMRTPAFQRGRYLVDPDGSGLSEHAVHHFHGMVLDAYRRAGAP